MTRILLLALVGLSLTACATTSSGGGEGMAMAAFDHVRAGEARVVTGYGYELTGQSGWTGRMAYVEEDHQARVTIRIVSAEGVSDYADLEISLPYLEDGVRRFHGQTDGGTPVAVELQAGPCMNAPGDGYTHFADIAYGDDHLAGCGSEVAQDDRWSNYLMDYLPAIDTCLAEFRDPTVHVSVAYTLPGGNTAIRVVDGDMQTWECATRDGDAAINSLRPLDAVDAVYGEGDPIFIRGRMPEFGAGCYVYESVRHADGQLIGAFGHDACNTTTVSARDTSVG